MSADVRYRSSGMAGFIAARVPDYELEDGQSAAPAIGLDRHEQDLERFGRARPNRPLLLQVPAEPESPRFDSFVSDLIGVEILIPNQSPDGGGLHQTTTGELINVHPRFTVHPNWSSWQRRANLLALNEDWRPENVGDLDLWNADMTRCVEGITPDPNSDQAAAKILTFGDRHSQSRRGGL